MNEDMTFCSKNCMMIECPLNRKNIQDKTRPHSYYRDLPKACPMLKAVENKMTLKEFSKKYGLEYYIVYGAVRESGLLKFGKNNKYAEEALALACTNYVFDRIDRHKHEIERYLGYAKQIDNALRQKVQEE